MYQKLKEILGLKKKLVLTEDEKQLLIYMYTYMFHGQHIYLKCEKRETKLFKAKDKILLDLLNLLKIICDNFEDREKQEKIKAILRKTSFNKYYEIETMFTLPSINELIKVIYDISNIQDDYLVEKFLEVKNEESKKEKYKFEVECYEKKVEEDLKKIVDLTFEYGDVMLIAKSVVEGSTN